MQCVAGVVDFAVQRIKADLLPQFPNVDDVIGLEHTYGCGVAIDAPGAEIPIRTLRNISLNPNFGGEVMVVSLGCEKLQPERCCRRERSRSRDERSVADVGANADRVSMLFACRMKTTSASCRWSIRSWRPRNCTSSA